MKKYVEVAPTAAGIKRGDEVRVITGRDRGKSGRVLSVNPGTRTVTVEHAGMIKRHTRPNPSKNVKGGIVEKRSQRQADLERAAVVPVLQQGRAHRAQNAAGRNQGAGLPPLRQHARKVAPCGPRVLGPSILVVCGSSWFTRLVCRGFSRDIEGRVEKNGFKPLKLFRRNRKAKRKETELKRRNAELKRRNKETEQ